MLTLAFNIQPVRASGTIYIRADGTIDPPTAPISTLDNVTYTFTDNIYESIVVEKGSIIVDGNGSALLGNGSGHGFYWTGISNVTIKNTNIKDFGYGIYPDSSSNNNIAGNTITDSGDGIELYYGSSNNSILENTIANNRRGIWLEGSSENSIVGNVFVNDGLVAWDLYGNVVVDNLVNGKPLVYLEDASDVVVEDAGQVILVNCNRMIVENLNLSNTATGVQLWGTSYTTIARNKITGNSCNGITLDDSSNNNSIVGNNITNKITSNVDGIFLHGSSNFNCIVGNSITSSRDGIFFDDSSNNNISQNNITANNWAGIELDYSSGNTIVGNSITHNSYYGIRLWPSSDNSIVGNIIEGNSQGIWLRESSDNKFYDNNFIDNSQQVYSYDGYANVWDNDYPSGGNYWSDYTGTDLYSGPYQNETGSDGKGDTPYVIDADNRDGYPLMHLWSSLPVHNINTGLDYATIQEAINNASDGDTVSVRSRTYYEDIVVNKSLTIFGETKDTTIVVGSPGNVVFRVESENVHISGFTVQNGNTGVQLDAQNATINDNIIANSTSQGFQVGGAGNTISRNLIVNCGAAITVFGNNHTIEQNVVMNNKYFSIHLYGGDSNKVRGNVITNNEGGEIYVMSSDNNTISDNALINNEEGIRIAYSTGNVIFHNHIINNTRQVFIDRGNINNTWDDGYPSGGNYWSDYNGTDFYSGLYQNETGSDGIGDTPYVIDENNQDTYPLGVFSAHLLGDLNLDGVVDILDAVQAASAFGSHPGDPGWNDQADLNHDNEVDIFDIIILANNFGRSARSSSPWLGASGTDMTYEIAQAMNTDITYGWLITQMTNGGSAETAGLRGGTNQVQIDGKTVTIGGDIVVGINGTRIMNTDDLSTYLEEYTLPGETIVVDLVRSNQILTLSVQLQAQP